MLLHEIANYADLRKNYIAALDAMSNVEIEDLSRNDLAQLLAISYSAVKSAQANYKTNVDLLLKQKSADIDNFMSAKTWLLEHASADEINELNIALQIMRETA